MEVITPVPPGAPRRWRVLIGEPDPLARQTITQAFGEAPDVSVIAATDDPRELIELARHYRPELTVIDSGGNGFNGWLACENIVRCDPGAKVLILEANPGVDRELGGLLAGANGVVSKAAGIGTIVETARAVADGDLPHSDEAMRLLLGRLRIQPESVVGMRPVRSLLTPREWEVLDLLTGEMTNREMAVELHLSIDTVSSHVKNLMRKLEVHSRGAAVESGHRLRLRA